MSMIEKKNESIAFSDSMRKTNMEAEKLECQLNKENTIIDNVSLRLDILEDAIDSNNERRESFKNKITRISEKL